MRVIKGLIGVAAFSLAVPASAQLVTFEGFTDNYSSSQTYNGYDFQFSAAGWAVVDGDFGSTPGQNVSSGSRQLLLSGGSPGLVNITQVGGGAFSVSGFDLATAFLRTAGTVSVTGTYADLTTVNISFNVTDSFASQFLPGTFSNLISIQFAEGTSNAFESQGLGLDNINFNGTPAVPEPSTWAMFLLGFGAVGYSMRRTRRAKAELGAA